MPTLTRLDRYSIRPRLKCLIDPDDCTNDSVVISFFLLLLLFIEDFDIEMFIELKKKKKQVKTIQFNASLIFVVKKKKKKLSSKFRTVYEKCTIAIKINEFSPS